MRHVLLNRFRLVCIAQRLLPCSFKATLGDVPSLLRVTRNHESVVKKRFDPPGQRFNYVELATRKSFYDFSSGCVECKEKEEKED